MKTKTFTVVMTSAYESDLSEFGMRGALSRAYPNAAFTVSEVNKTHCCDGCNKQRRDVKSCGRDSNGEPDGPDLCFICRKENEKGHVWSDIRGRYVRY